MTQIRHWAYALLLSGTFLPISAVHGQYSVHPSYLPEVSEAYFGGDSSKVYPDPYRAPEKFTPAPGESHPVPRQEVRARARAERREQIRKRYFTTAPRETETVSPKDSQTENSNFRYPDPDLLDSFPQKVPHSPLTSLDLETPAPSHWNEEGGTAALPHPEASEKQHRSSAQPQVPVQPILEDVTETAGQMHGISILEDVPAEHSVLKQGTAADPEKESLYELDLPQVPESDESDFPLSVPPALETYPETAKKPAEAKSILQKGSAPEELQPTARFRTQPSALKRSAEKQTPAEKTRSGLILEEVPEEVSDDILLLETPVEDDIFSLETVPSQTDRRPEERSGKAVPQPRSSGNSTSGSRRSVLETTHIFHDPAIQPAAFWGPSESSSKETSGRMRYPTTRKSSSPKSEMPEAQGKNVSYPFEKTSKERIQTGSETPRSMPLASAHTSGNYGQQNQRSYPEVPMQQKTVSSKERNAYPRIEYPTSKSAPSTSANIQETASIVPERTASRPTAQTAQKNAPAPAAPTLQQTQPTRSVSPRSEMPAAVPPRSTSEKSGRQQEVATYTPVFSSRNSPMQKLTVAVPARTVFQDFSEQRLIEKGPLHWSTKYIRALNMNEEHLFNALRVLGSTKLSQSRCRFSLMEAAIIASRPSTAADANRLVHIYDNIEFHLLKKTQLADQRQDLTLHERELLKAEMILDFMHQNITHEYRLEGTTMTNLLEHGRFNCVTGSILYCSLAEKAGLNVTAVELPGHAMCWVYLSNGEKLEVETTCASWFRYRNDPETQRKVICKLIRDASPHLKDQTDQMLLHQVPQPISDKRLIAKIYYNRGVDLLGINDFAGALEANAIAYCLDPQSKTTFGNLLATMNNWAIVLCNQKQFEQAAALLRTGLAHEPSYPPFQNNHTHVYHYWVEYLYRQGDIREALAIADTAGKEQPSQKRHFTLLQKQIRGAKAAADDEILATQETGTSVH